MPTRRGNRNRRALALAGAVPLALALTACGDDTAASQDVDAAEDDVAAVDSDDEQLAGLEVTATGNVSEVVDDLAFTIDRDGLGQEGVAAGDVEEDDAVVDAMDDDFLEDDDYYTYDDFDAYTEFDEDFGVDEATGVLVLALEGVDVEVGDATKVTGTVRTFDESTLEDVYDVELDDDLYDGFDQETVIVADQVASGASVPADTATPTESGSPTATASATPTS